MNIGERDEKRRGWKDLIQSSVLDETKERLNPLKDLYMMKTIIFHNGEHLKRLTYV